MPHSQGIDRNMKECIEECADCHEICTEAAQHLLAEGEPEGRHVRLLLDCAQICATSADFMLRGSDLHGVTCGACAEVCDACAEACEESSDDRLLRKCAEICRSCAESCRRMAGRKGRSFRAGGQA